MEMSKQVTAKTKKVKPAPRKPSGGKPLAAAGAKSSSRSSSAPKPASLKSTSPRKVAAPPKKPKTPSKTGLKSAKVAMKDTKTVTGPVKSATKGAVKSAPSKSAPSKAAPKPEKPQNGSSIGRRVVTAKPSRAKSIADSRKAPVMARKPVPLKPVARTEEKKPAAPAAKAYVQAAGAGKSAAPASKKPSGPAPLTQAAAMSAEKQAQAPAIPYKAPSEFDGFKVNDHVVYPTHGVGKIVAVEAQEIAGTRLELFVIAFDQEKMTLRVPLGKAKAVGMRILSSRDTVRAALKTLQGRARIKRTMWSRRAQEYEAKINSGDLMLIAEVVRDLHRAEGQPEQSYSERQIYESALERMAREVGAIEELDNNAAMERVGIALKPLPACRG
jgi:CarD family transcriptional regulator